MKRYVTKKGYPACAEQWTEDKTLRDMWGVTFYEDNDCGIIGVHNYVLRKKEYPLVQRGDWIVISDNAIRVIDPDTFRNDFKTLIK